MNDGSDEERMAAERRAADRVRGDRAEHDQAERARLEVAQDQLEREEHAGDRRVERRRDPARGAAGDQQPQLRLGTRRSSWPVTEPSAEPICTIGPSRPTEPPEPMQIAEASDFTTGTCGRIRPPCRLTAYITSGTPCPRASGAKRLDQRPVDQAADDRREHDEPDPEARQERIDRVARRAVVAMAGEQVGEAEDHVAKRDRAHPRAAPVSSANAISPPLPRAAERRSRASHFRGERLFAFLRPRATSVRDATRNSPAASWAARWRARATSP